MDIIFHGDEIPFEQLKLAIGNSWVHFRTNILKGNNLVPSKCFDASGWDFDPAVYVRHYRPAPSSVVVHDKPTMADSRTQYSGRYYFSTVQIEEQYSSIANICLYLYRIEMSSQITCTNQLCFFNFDSHNRSSLHNICDNCQEQLLSKGLFDAYIRIIILQNALGAKGIENELVQTHIANVLSRLQVTLHHYKLRDFATSLILDTTLPQSVVKWLKTVSTKAEKRKLEIKRDYKSTTISLPDKPFVITSRHWNSWTPSTPGKETESNHPLGGGALIFTGNDYIAIDPGFGFIKQIYSNFGITVYDLSAIVVSHDHSDHSADLPSILGLRFVYRKKCKQNLKLFLNPSSYNIHKNLCLYYNKLLEHGAPKCIKPGQEFRVGDTVFRTIETIHKELLHHLIEDSKTDSSLVSTVNRIGANSPLGFDIHGIYHDTVFRFAFPGDTGFPNSGADLLRFFNFFGNPATFATKHPKIVSPTTPIDIAVLHMGSVEDAWSQKLCTPSSVRYQDNNHLGVTGIARFINVVQPKVAIITEFGEELGINSYRLALNEIIKVLALYKPQAIIPSDSSLLVVLDTDAIRFRCCSKDIHNCNLYPPIQNLLAHINDKGMIVYDYEPGCPSKLHHHPA